MSFRMASTPSRSQRCTSNTVSRAVRRVRREHVSDFDTTGPIVRISPHELHVSDPAFFETLYRQDGRWDKYGWTVGAFAADGAGIFTVDHDLHKARRQPLNPFFSKPKVASQQHVIRENIDVLCHRLSDFAASQKAVDLGAAVTALARDVANDYILGKSYNSLGKDDFDADMVIVSQGGARMWRISKQIRFIAHLMRSVPVDWMLKIGDKKSKAFFRHLQVSSNRRRRKHFNSS